VPDRGSGPNESTSGDEAGALGLGTPAALQRELASIHRHTGRNTVLYFSGWLAGTNVPGHLVSMNESDIDAIVEICRELDQDALDLIVHSPGGSSLAAEQIVEYLRSTFSSLRVIVPRKAMSAATMLACAADEILMARHSFLGPIDPQLIADGQFIPAQLLIDKLRIMLDSAQDHERISIIKQEAHTVLEAQYSLKLGREMVESWLAMHMLAGQAEVQGTAAAIARYLSQFHIHKNHGRPIHATKLKSMGLMIKDMEEDQVLYDHVMAVGKHARAIATQNAAVKIIAAHSGAPVITGPHEPLLA
jgi:ATP-dependent protease ClpP protease subunit